MWNACLIVLKTAERTRKRPSVRTAAKVDIVDQLVNNDAVLRGKSLGSVVVDLHINSEHAGCLHAGVLEDEADAFICAGGYIEPDKILCTGCCLDAAPVEGVADHAAGLVVEAAGCKIYGSLAGLSEFVDSTVTIDIAAAENAVCINIIQDAILIEVHTHNAVADGANAGLLAGGDIDHVQLGCAGNAEEDTIGIIVCHLVVSVGQGCDCGLVCKASIGHIIAIESGRVSGGDCIADTVFTVITCCMNILPVRNASIFSPRQACLPDYRKLTVAWRRLLSC